MTYPYYTVLRENVQEKLGFTGKPGLPQENKM